MRTQTVSRAHVSPRGVPAHACSPNTYYNVLLLLPYSFVSGNATPRLVPYSMFYPATPRLWLFLLLNTFPATPLRNYQLYNTHRPFGWGAYCRPWAQGMTPPWPPLFSLSFLLAVPRLRRSLSGVSLCFVPLVHDPVHPYLDPVPFFRYPDARFSPFSSATMSNTVRSCFSRFR